MILLWIGDSTSTSVLQTVQAPAKIPFLFFTPAELSSWNVHEQVSSLDEPFDDDDDDDYGGVGVGVGVGVGGESPLMSDDDDNHQVRRNTTKHQRSDSWKKKKTNKEEVHIPSSSSCY
jgi:hypothetical protein